VQERPKLLTLIILAIVLIAAAASAQERRPAHRETTIQGHTMHTLLKPGDIPAIFAPEFLSVGEAGSLYHPDEPLLVVTAGEVAKAYSTWHLDRHEVVNDAIAGVPIATTW
jgi:hypothetical protein